MTSIQLSPQQRIAPFNRGIYRANQIKKSIFGLSYVVCNRSIKLFSLTSVQPRSIFLWIEIHIAPRVSIYESSRLGPYGHKRFDLSDNGDKVYHHTFIRNLKQWKRFQRLFAVKKPRSIELLNRFFRAGFETVDDQFIYFCHSIEKRPDGANFFCTFNGASNAVKTLSISELPLSYPYCNTDCSYGTDRLHPCSGFLSSKLRHRHDHVHDDCDSRNRKRDEHDFFVSFIHRSTSQFSRGIVA